MTPITDRLFTAGEAGAINGVNAKAVHNIIDKQLIDLEGRRRTEVVAKPAKGGSRLARKQLTGEDLVRIAVWYTAGRDLAPEARRSLVKAMDATPKAKLLPASEYLTFDVQAVRRRVVNRIKALVDADALIHSDRDTLGGEPVFRGTRIPVHGVADMLRAGAEAEDLLSGYPKLTARMLEVAPLWSAAHPRRGRPRKSAKETRKDSRRVTVKPDPITMKGPAR